MPSTLCPGVEQSGREGRTPRLHSETLPDLPKEESKKKRVEEIANKKEV